ncbi:maleylpyruvate isomerase [Brevibacterium sediminis]|uniref:Maleylpyruvate isomerase n=1 Tax=Brevibacterium sediminis TaxID=1857024 RepID=A0ABQ1MVU9_9MICO|nr:maleylpyruvate isomerase N-terminal domain-containing protein [Brevibacterium sediminis]GGC45566.1 maleylpyruvate isomerase [Brevibacterium sediminis]
MSTDSPADHFSQAWTALLRTVAGLRDGDFGRASGCAGWRVQDLVCHLIIDAQDVLITLVTPSEGAPTHDSATYWTVTDFPPTGDDPLDALIPRLAAAYEDPQLLKFHLDDVGTAADRAARLADPERRVETQHMVLTIGDFLNAYVLEWTLHHFDLIAHLPNAPTPPTGCVARSRTMFEDAIGATIPAELTDAEALLIGTGRRPPDAAQRSVLGDIGERLPFILS